MPTAVLLPGHSASWRAALQLFHLVHQVRRLPRHLPDLLKEDRQLLAAMAVDLASAGLLPMLVGHPGPTMAHPSELEREAQAAGHAPSAGTSLDPPAPRAASRRRWAPTAACAGPQPAAPASP